MISTGDAVRVALSASQPIWTEKNAGAVCEMGRP